MTTREKELVEAATKGIPLVCGNLSMEDLASTEDPRYVIPADLIRELLLGRHGDLDPRGVWLVRAHITGTLDLDHVHAQVPLTLHECVIGPILLANAHLRRVDLSRSQVAGLLGDGLRVDGSMFLRDGFRATGVGDGRTVWLLGAHITGNLEMSGALLTNQTGPALQADGMRVDSSLFLRDGFQASGAGEHGTVRLVNAHITGNLEMSGAQVTNQTGPALHADRLRIDSSMYLRSGFQATGAGEHGTVRLVNAHITGNLEMDSAQVTNQTGPALVADGLLIDGDMYLRSGFRASGAGEDGTLRLLGTNVAGDLDMSHAVVDRGPGLTVDLERAHVGTGCFVPTSVICPIEAETSRACPHAERHIDLNEFTFGSIGRGTWQQWLHLIRCHTTIYRPTPYQRLAASERAAGHDGVARRILIEQQRDLHARGDIGGRLARLTHWLWGAVAGYGYRARRTAIALLLALALAGGLGFWAGHWVTGPGHHAAERTAASGSPPGTPCSTIEQIGLGIDRGLPLAPAGIRSRCDLDTGSTAGQWFTVGIWVLQGLVWALATLALAGYTGLIRKVA